MAASIATDRMLLRRVTGEDLDWLAGLYGDSRVMRYIDDGQPVPEAVVAGRILPAILRECAQLPDGLGYYAAIERGAGRPLGWISLRPPSSVGLRPQDSTELTTAQS